MRVYLQITKNYGCYTVHIEKMNEYVCMYLIRFSLDVSEHINCEANE